MSDIKEISLSNTVYDIKVKNDHALKSYLDDGTLLTDSEGLSDVKSYAHSTYDSSKFTVVGSPTITDDGIASGFSASNYLTVNGGVIFNPGTDAWEITTKITTGNSTAIQWIEGCSNASGYLGVIFGIYSTGRTRLWLSYDGTSLQTFDGQLVSVNTTYWFKYGWDGTQYYIKRSTDGTTYTTDGTLTSSSTVHSSYFLLGAAFSRTGAVFQGSLDLKEFSITVGGVEVFSGNKTGTDTYTINGSTVSIPFTYSKTGSKIVDSYYRTQVTSVYNAYGYAPYYTLSDTDFTLPMGEIYGLMGSANIIQTYIDPDTPTNGYRIWSDGYCEQWGVTASGANSYQTLTLLKTYKDTNYNIIMSGRTGTGGSTTTVWSLNTSQPINGNSFTYFAVSWGNSWRAYGYLAEGEY